MVKCETERYIKTIETVERRTRMDSELSVKLWCQSTESVIEIYNMVYHITLKKAPDWILDNTKRNIHDLRV